VVEFGEPGGMMDHYATTMGGILYQEFNQTVMTKSFDTNMGCFVLGDSLEPKDTKGILKRVKMGVLDAVKRISDKYPEFDLNEFPINDINKLLPRLKDDQRSVFEGALLNREITKIAFNMFSDNDFDHKEFGRLLNDHQEILDKKLTISTAKINHMLERAIRAGAYGGKINGSGGGGCMFCYAPEDPERVAKAINDAGGKAYIIQIDEGLKVDNTQL
jgi:galactokinase